MKKKIFIGKVFGSDETFKRIIDERSSGRDYLYFEDGDERYNIEDEVIEEIDEDDIDEEWWETIDIESYDIEEIS